MAYGVMSDSTRLIAFPSLRLLTGVFFLGWALHTLPPVQATEIISGELRGSFDTTLSHGFTFRVAEHDESLTGLNSDDGTRNYSRGLVSNTSKFTSELELNYQNFGLFTRFTGFVDFENRNGTRDHIPLSEEAQDVAGDDIELLDLFVANTFDIDETPLDVRLGKHVLNWGESTFIRGGINVINPFDVTKFRTPGAELREGLVPVPILSASIAPTDNLSVEGFYQLQWENTEVDASGAYFSTNDYLGAGGNTAFLSGGFLDGATTDMGGGFGALTPAINGAIVPAGLPAQPLHDPRFLGVRRGPDREPDDSGQWGLAIHYFAETLNDTEFGFYFINHHSHLPLLSAIPRRAGYDAGLAAAAAVSAPTSPVVSTVSKSACAQTLRLPALCSDAQLGQFLASLDSAQAKAFNDRVTANISGVAGLLAIDRYARTARYYTEYPEDLQTMGISFNTVHTDSGWALQGEYTFHSDAPLQRTEESLLTEGLSPIIGALQLGPQIKAAVARGDMATAGQLSAALGALEGRLDKPVQGYIERDVSQFQVTATKLFTSTLGADTLAVIAEAAVMHVHNMPDEAAIPLDSSGIGSELADANSLGYRAAILLNYNNAIGAARLSPYLQWQHDVSGSSPTPSGAFLDGRKVVTLGLGVSYLDRWQGDLSYTMHTGDNNQLSDRDFVSTVIKYSF